MSSGLDQTARPPAGRRLDPAFPAHRLCRPSPPLLRCTDTAYALTFYCSTTSQVGRRPHHFSTVRRPPLPSARTTRVPSPRRHARPHARTRSDPSTTYPRPRTPNHPSHTLPSQPATPSPRACSPREASSPLSSREAQQPPPPPQLPQRRLRERDRDETRMSKCSAGRSEDRDTRAV